MSEFKPTPGEWKVVGYVQEDDGYPEIVIQGGDLVVAVVIHITDQKSFQDNAKLIADAGNTYHATGMTPSQLAERVKVLEDALSSCIYNGSMTGDDWVTSKALKALAKITTSA